MSDRFDQRYELQVRLLLEVIPIISQFPRFAIKGGTAINFFIRDLNRLSVDIDLSYLPVEPRLDSIADINKILADIAAAIPKKIKSAVVKPNKSFNSGKELKILVELGNTIVKIEPNYILRGFVFPPSQRKLSQKCTDHFGPVVFANIVSIEDLYAGKICAALDRQHPRDLFDVHFFLINEGFTENVRKAFLVYLMSHNRPMSEVLDPNWQDIASIYNNEFLGMSRIDLTLEELYQAGKDLLTAIRRSLTDKDRQFLLSFKSGNPDWNTFFKPEVQNLPAIIWKQRNLEKLPAAKRIQALKKLDEVLSK